jgi:hypothetical protein
VRGTSRDPFAVDEDRWLERLAIDWGTHYLISPPSDGRWIAIKRDGSSAALIRETPWELDDAIRADITAGSIR